MARRIAVDLLKKHKAKFVKVKLAYAIGKAQPVMAAGEIQEVGSRKYEVGISKQYDLTPGGIKKLLKLNHPIYKKTALWGHFGRDFIWDK